MADDTESQPLLRAPTAPVQSVASARRFPVRAVVVIAASAIAALMLVSSQNKSIQRHIYSSAPVMMFLSTEKQVMLAKEGTIMYSSLPSSAVDTLFTEFKITYAKAYPTATDEDTALKKFKKTLVNVDLRNENDRAAGGRCAPSSIDELETRPVRCDFPSPFFFSVLSAIHGVTQFADLDEDEFKAYYLSYRPEDEEKRAKVRCVVWVLPLGRTLGHSPPPPLPLPQT